jgi:hypothetical protein
MTQESEYDQEPPSTWVEDRGRRLAGRYRWARGWVAWWCNLALRPPPALDFGKIVPGSVPVLINNFNRLDTLRGQLSWLLTLEGSISIIIIDNASTYPPLLEFYRALDRSNVQVVHLGFNSCDKGAAYVAGQLTGCPRFIVTDPDLLPYPTTPEDIVPHLESLLARYPDYNHVGLSLEIEDLPDHCFRRERILQHERQYWPPQSVPLNDEVYVAPVDTTFAMYRATSNVRAHGPALRTCRPYTLRHVDWYLDPANLSDEYRYYLSVATRYATWAMDLKASLARKG